VGYLWQETFKIHDSLEIAVFVFYSISCLVRKGAVVCPDFYLNDGHISIYCEEKPLIWLNDGKKTFLFEGMFKTLGKSKRCREPGLFRAHANSPQLKQRPLHHQSDVRLPAEPSRPFVFDLGTSL